ncbi:MAG: GNAT family N-acetyltransferase [Alphaproteobacteria bacterium]|nr:GNAT family N-acetyltransferase [Alphaproteobacteria bacterium]
MNIPTLTAARFTLRAFREDDVPALTALHSDPEVMRFLRPNGEPEPNPRLAWEYMAMQMGHWLLKGYGKWAMADRTTDELVGRVGYFDSPYEWPGLELGWTISRSLWGQGYASEAARLALNWGFETLATNEIISAIHPGNVASMRVAERIGERRLREGHVLGQPCLIYGISRDEWKVSRR